MKLDVSYLLRHDSEVMEVEMSGKKELFTHLKGDIKSFSDVSLKGKLTNLKGVLSFKGVVTFHTTAECARCLAGVNRTYNIEVNENFYTGDFVKTNVEYFYAGKYVDFKEFVVDEIALAIPSRHLCTEECNGLCPNCGINLNINNCNCVETNFDPGTN